MAWTGNTENPRSNVSRLHPRYADPHFGEIDYESETLVLAQGVPGINHFAGPINIVKDNERTIRQMRMNGIEIIERRYPPVIAVNESEIDGRTLLQHQL